MWTSSVCNSFIQKCFKTSVIGGESQTGTSWLTNLTKNSEGLSPRSRNIPAFAIYALVILGDQFSLIHTLLLNLLWRIKMEDNLVTLFTPNWPRRTCYLDLVRLIADLSRAVLEHPDLSQNPVCHPDLRPLSLKAWLFLAQVLRNWNVLHLVMSVLSKARKSTSYKVYHCIIFFILFFNSKHFHI